MGENPYSGGQRMSRDSDPTNPGGVVLAKLVRSNLGVTAEGCDSRLRIEQTACGIV